MIDCGADPKNDGRRPAAAAETAACEHRVLIFAPSGNDARLTAGFLSQTGLIPHVCRDGLDLAQEVSRGCGTIILAEEALNDPALSGLISTLAGQPAWSDLPVVLVTSGGEAGQAQLRRLAAFGARTNVIQLERPFRPGTLLSTLEAALRARQRQYEARDLVLTLERAHGELQAALRAKDDFLAALSHELRTPLNPVLLIASDRATNQNLTAEVRADFELVRKNIELEARLIDDLLDLTRISCGKLVLNRQRLNLRTVLHDAITTVEEEIGRKQISVELDFGRDEGIIEGDAVRLQQVFWNILKNAAKFTPPGGCITVATRSQPATGKIAVQITDTGIGLTAEEINHIFNAFAQGDHAGSGGSHRFGGLGLGLAISRKLVELHDGVILAESPGRDQGATFTVELPLAQAADDGPGQEPAKIQPNSLPPLAKKAGGLRILLVEDHEPTRLALGTLLTRRDYRVTTAVSVTEARACAAKKNIDFVISDIGLPDGTGYSLMSELRDKFGLKGIALSGYGMEQDVALSQSAGFIAHLIKPIRVELLEQMLAEVASGHDHEHYQTH